MAHSEVNTAYGYQLHEKMVSFWSLLLSYGFRLLLGTLILFITTVLSIILPMLINAGVSFITTKQPVSISLPFGAVSFTSIISIVVAMVIIATMGALLRTLSRMLLFDVGRLIERDIRARLFYHCTLLDESSFKKFSVGNLMNHLVSDVGNVRMVVGFAILNVLNIAFIFCFTVPLLIKIDPLIAAIALSPFPLIALFMSGITTKMFLATITYQETLSTMVSHIQENLLGAHVVRLCHKQQEESRRFLPINQKTFNAGIKVARLRTLMMPCMRLLVGVSVGGVLYMGGNAVLSSRISLGDFVEINTRILQLAWPAMSVGFVMSIVSRGQASLKRLNQALQIAPEITDGYRNIAVTEQLSVRNLKLSSTALGINFNVKKGLMLAVVGPSGSYKTTLLRALSRRMVIPDNAIFFDDVDSAQLSLTSLYQQVSFVTQEPFLFNITIRDNMCFQNPDVSEQKLDEVIKLLGLDQDFLHLRDGMNTIVGERGVLLSGGQKQRIALARALLADRPILLIDDALSAVDKNTEHHIVSHIKPFIQHKIVVIATHRLLISQKADNIIVLDKGNIVELGSHDQLINHQGLYRSLWDMEHVRGIGP